MAQPLATNVFGLYQIILLLAALMNRAYRLLLIVPRLIQFDGYCWLMTLISSIGFRGVSCPALAIFFINPGLGRMAISGGLPASSRVVRTAVKSRVPVKFIFAPVACSQGAIIALKLSNSELPQIPRTSTVLPAGSGANGEAEAAGDAVEVGLADGDALAVGLAEGEAAGEALADAVGETLADAVGEITGDEAAAVAVGEEIGEVVVGEVVVVVIGGVVVAVGLPPPVQDMVAIRISIIPSINSILPKVSCLVFTFEPPD
jgi:hypothetical protein